MSNSREPKSLQVLAMEKILDSINNHRKAVMKNCDVLNKQLFKNPDAITTVEYFYPVEQLVEQLPLPKALIAQIKSLGERIVNSYIYFSSPSTAPVLYCPVNRYKVTIFPLTNEEQFNWVCKADNPSTFPLKHYRIDSYKLL
jgi:hypothetical protein